MIFPFITRNLAVLAGISLLSQAAASVTIDWVTVGNAGNAADTTLSWDGFAFGAVNYEYKNREV